MNNRKMKPIAAAIGAAFAMSLTAGAVADEVNPFEAQLIEDGTLLAAGHKEGGCGEDRDKPAKEGDEANCGEGECGEHGEDKSGDSDEGEGDADSEGESSEH